MAAPRLTRRSLLAATAASAAGGLVRPTGALGALGAPPKPSLSTQGIGALGPAGLTVKPARVADLVGVEWAAPSGAAVELRFADRAGRWSAWVDAGPRGHGPDGAASPTALVGDPVWTGGTGLLQLRSSRALSGVRLHLVDVSGGRGVSSLVGAAARSPLSALDPFGSAASLQLAQPVLDAGPGQPPIIARRVWAQGVSHPRVAPEYGDVQMAFVHHSDNPNGYLPGEVAPMLRAIYTFHRYVNGWDDIGYNFAIDAFGRIFEARAGGIDEPVIGAHAGGYNYASTGVVVLGTYTSVPISTAAAAALAHLLAWKLALHGVPAQGRVTVRVNAAGASYSRFPANARVSLAHISGHRDADSTDCPGDVLYGQLPAIRTRVGKLAAAPSRATLQLSTPATAPTAAPPPVTTTPGQPPSTSEATLEGALEMLDGTPLTGRSIAVQARSVSRRGEVVSETTLAQVVTDGQGRWTLPVSLTREAQAPRSARATIVLRALYMGDPGGAAVSAPLEMPATQVTPTAPTATTEPGGSPSPSAAGPPSP